MNQSSSDPRATNAAFYDENAAEYDENTAHLDMSALYAPFLERVPAGGRVLDAGCGPGRDARRFREMGFDVTAMDASAEMVRLAGERTGLRVRHQTFQDLDDEATFDGVWACASLLHVPRAEMPGVLERLSRALRPAGALYVSFKHGALEGWRNGRWFTDWDEAGLARLLETRPELSAARVWVTEDLRPGRAERWLNAVLVKAR